MTGAVSAAIENLPLVTGGRVLNIDGPIDIWVGAIVLTALCLIVCFACAGVCELVRAVFEERSGR